MAARELRAVVIALVAALAGYLLAGGGGLPGAYGQSEGRSKDVICVVGEAVNQYAPIVLVDVADETIMIYEYSYQNDEIELTAARTYRYDKLLEEFNPQGVTVQQVKQAVTGGGGSR